MGKDIPATTGDLVVRVVDGAEGTLERVEEAEGDRVEPACSALTRRSQHGMVSAEWAVGIVAAVAIAGVLLAVITSGQVQDALLKFILWVIKGFISVVE
jgi:Protein of unknown function (DUF4244)